MAGKDKLYSRRKIRLPNLSFIRQMNSFKMLLLILLISILLSVCSFLYSAYPVFKATCETAAVSKGNKIINEEVSKVMKDYSYNSLIRIEKDINGRISFIEADSSKINEIVSEINYNIQKRFDGIPRINVFINMGTVSGISMLKNWDPKFELELESAGNLNSKLKTEFHSVGINQTKHQILLELDARVGILTPFSTFGKDIHSDIVLTEAIIVGEVPESFYDLNERADLSDTYNFVE